MTGIYFPYFQPIVNLNDGKILSYEALARTKQDDKIVSAGNIFHSNQYTTDQIIEIDRHIRRTALEHLSHNPQVNILSLNISPLWIDRLAENEIIPTLRMLDELAIDPQKVVIEITELAGELEKLKRIAKEYQSHGIKIAVDDFGAGASQMDRILALEPEVIKLDMHILKAAAKGNAEASIALSFANLAQRSDSVMVCEGVENEEEFHFSIECGADCIQGWLFEPALANFIDADSTVEKTMRLKRSYLERKSILITSASSAKIPTN
jgi:EAL domain-containing protein (putative c-di-GMP-specific phosphodiesterase class I)